VNGTGSFIGSVSVNAENVLSARTRIAEIR